MFASKIQKQVTFDDGSVTIRKLSAKSLEKAAEQRQIAVAQFTSQMGAEIMKMWTTKDKDAVAAPAAEVPIEEQRKARYGLYDRFSVLKAGVVSWSYPEKIHDGIEDLDEDAVQKLHEEILDLSLPPLTQEEREAASAKDFGLSTSI
jgi:ribosome recycling factor